MESTENPALSESVAAAFAWWREAGVDCDYNDTPTDWLTGPGSVPGNSVPKPAPASSRLAAKTVVAPELQEPVVVAERDWPRDLAAFQEWWLREPSLDDGRLSGRIAPRGAPGARTMVIVPEPERDDSETLLSGPQGRLLDAILTAMEITPEDAYIASVLPRHMPMADWAALRRKGFTRLTAHHVGLVGPERLFVFDSNIWSLVGNDPPNTPETLRRFNHDGASIPLFAARGLEALLERPRWKAALWESWLDWSAKTGPG